jgi:hypothetical protein
MIKFNRSILQLSNSHTMVSEVVDFLIFFKQISGEIIKKSTQSFLIRVDSKGQ